jgi:hypothetical protein
VRRLDDGGACGAEIGEGMVDIVGPDDHDHRGAARRRVDSVNPPCRFHCSQADGNAAQGELDVLGSALGRRTERLLEPEQVPVEQDPRLDVARVQVHEPVDEHLGSLCRPAAYGT